MCSDYCKELETALEQACSDLNAAHNEILRQQNADNTETLDWPCWSPQANTIRWAERLLDKKLAKTNNWTLYPTNQDNE